MKLSTPHGHGFFHHGFFSRHEVYDEAGIHRGWVTAIGILFLVLGVLGLAMTSLMTVASVVIFGLFAIVGGIVQISVSFASHGSRNAWMGVVLGALYLFAGLVMVSNPVASSMILTLFLAAALIGLGIARIMYWMQHRGHRYWAWSVVSGVISLILGIMIIAQWPVTGLWVIGLFVSLEMIFHGAAAIALATESKRIA